MKHFYSFPYFLKLAFVGIFRNAVMTIASLFALFCCLLVVGSFYLLTVNIDHNLEGLDDYNKIVAFVNEDTTEGEIEDVRNSIAELQKITSLGISSVEYISKDQALQDQLQEYRDNPSISDEEMENIEIMLGNANPLKAYFVLSYKDTSAANSIVIRLTSGDLAEYFNDVRDNSAVSAQIDGLRQIISFVCAALMILLFVVSLFVIMNTTKVSIYSRREEIFIMRYVGATSFFVCVPYVLEGVVIGLISAVLAFGAQFYLYKYVWSSLPALGNFVTVISFADVWWIVAVGFVAVGLFTGLVGSMFAIRNYKKV